MLECNAPNWKGGITPVNERIRKSLEYRLWRNEVFKRDNWTCQECDKKGGILNAHHIKNFVDFPELRTSLENGITLCEKCHRRLHIHNDNARSSFYSPKGRKYDNEKFKEP